MKKILACILIAISFSVSAQQQTLVDAATQGKADMAMQLLKAGADPNTVDKNGISPLMAACRWGHIEVVRLLLGNGATPDQPRSPKGRTPLMVACSYYSGLSVIKLLVEKGADINVKAQDGTTPLMLAARNAKYEVVEYLLSKGADPFQKDNEGANALDYALKADTTAKDMFRDMRIDKQGVILLLKNTKQ
jgi:ankyrin repeat protein